MDQTSILEMLNRRNQASNPVNGAVNTAADVRSVADSILNSSNPTATIQQMAQYDPQVKQGVDFVSNYGSYKEAALAFARNNGVDIDSYRALLGGR